MKSPTEMLQLFDCFRAAIRHMLRIASCCRFSLLKPHYQSSDEVDVPGKTPQQTPVHKARDRVLHRLRSLLECTAEDLQTCLASRDPAAEHQEAKVWFLPVTAPPGPPDV